jgi:hypothetical protein
MTLVARRPVSPSDSATTRVVSEGFELPAQPPYVRPRLRDVEITGLDNEKLTELLVEYTEWMNYAAVQFAIAEINESELEEKVATAEAEAMVRDWGGTSANRVTIAKAEKQKDPVVQAAKQQLLTAYAYRKMTKVIVESIERELFAVSREITRRTGGSSSRAERYSR